MKFVNAIDKVLSFVESMKSNGKEAMSKEAQKVNKATQEMINEDIKRRREEIRLARQQVNNSHNPSKEP